MATGPGGRGGIGVLCPDPSNEPAVEFSRKAVQTWQPKRLGPQLGLVVSTTSGHSPPSDAPWYMPRSDLLSWPQGFLTCIR